MKNNVPIGPLIKTKFDARRKHDRNFTVRRFAEQINVHRATVYQLFKQQSIDIYLLERISKVLECDLLTEIYGDARNNNAVVEGDSCFIIGVKISSAQLKKLKLPKDFLCLIEQV